MNACGPNAPFQEGTAPTRPTQTYHDVRPGDDGVSMYRLLISAVTPRPIFLVSTISDEGVVNVAPYSYSSIIAHNPPTIAFTCTHSSKGVIRDTLRNVRANRQCVVNTVNEWFLEHANHTAGNFPENVSEMDHAHLTPLPSMLVAPPRVGESAVQMECTVESFHETHDDNGVTTCTTVFCRVRAFHISDQVYDAETHQVDPLKHKVVSRLGGNVYGETGKFWDIARPKWNSDSKKCEY